MILPKASFTSACLAAKFDSSDIIEALKALWESCRNYLERLGLTFLNRCSSDSRSAFDAVFSNIVTAFEKHDLDLNSLPLIYCEANQLVDIPSLELDPTSQQLQLDTKAISDLTASVKQLPNLIVKPVVEQRSSDTQSLKSLIETALQLKDHFQPLLIMQRAILNILHHAVDFLRLSTLIDPQPSVDRSQNIIIFGLR